MITPPIPAPEGEVPPRAYACRDKRFPWRVFDIQFGVHALATLAAQCWEQLEYLSLAEHEQLLSAEKQRGLRAVEEAQIGAATLVLEELLHLSIPISDALSDNIRIRLAHVPAWAKTRQNQIESRAAKEPS